MLKSSTYDLLSQIKAGKHKKNASELKQQSENKKN